MLFKSKQRKEDEHLKNRIEDSLETVRHFKKLLEKEKENGKGKLRSSIPEIKRSVYAGECFTDGMVVYVPAKGKAVFVGDIHGDLEAVASIIRQSRFVENLETGNKNFFLVFLGDYTDRGRKDIATIHIIMGLKIRYPDNVILLRGNHEDAEVAGRYGLYSSCVDAYGRSEGMDFFNQYMEAVKHLPVIVITANGMVGVHGGVPKEKMGSLEDLNGARAGELIFGMTWNDPTTLVPGMTWNQRGGGVFSFGEKSFEDFMGRIGAKVMVRSHEAMTNGVKLLFGDRLATIFSNGTAKGSSGYGDRVFRPVFLEVGLEEPKTLFYESDFIEIDYR